MYSHNASMVHLCQSCLSLGTLEFSSFTNNTKKTEIKKMTCHEERHDSDTWIPKPAIWFWERSLKKLFLTGCKKTAIQQSLAHSITSSAADVSAVSIQRTAAHCTKYSVPNNRAALKWRYLRHLSSLRKAVSFWGSHARLYLYSPSWESIANPGQTVQGRASGL